MFVMELWGSTDQHFGAFEKRKLNVDQVTKRFSAFYEI